MERKKSLLDMSGIKMENKKYHTIRTILQSIAQIVERRKIHSPNTQIHYHSLSGLVQELQ